MKSRVLAVIAVALLLQAGLVSAKKNVIYPLHKFVEGKSMIEWTDQWWKWTFETPIVDGKHPIFDKDGELCAIGQDNDVWFLTGWFIDDLDVPNSDGIYEVTRTCQVPANKSIFIPILNVECNNWSDENGGFFAETEDEMRSCVELYMDGPVATTHGISLVINGKEVVNDKNKEKVARIQSEMFTVNFPESNVAGANVAMGNSVSDGYWAMMKPKKLNAGTTHYVEFGGKFVDANDPNNLFFGLKVNYILEIVGEQ